MATADTHTAAQEFERDWWGDCTNTFGEEAKQLTYAHRMGLEHLEADGRWPVYDLGGRSVLDLGGGPVSILLKCVNGNGAVVDPCPYPGWVRARYEAAEIVYRVEPAETFVLGFVANEAWIYNVLQHVIDPEQVVAAARRSADVVRLFEWVEHGTDVGHPHTLHAHDLNRWLRGTGNVGMVDENGAVGLAYWGVFDV